MEDIEYLEEYEDLVLPAINSAAAEAAASSASFETKTNQLNQKIHDEADDSSSSLDQDIFNCLFDDNSDDEDYNNYQNSDCEPALRTKTVPHETLVSLEDNFEKIGNAVIEKVEISRQDPPKQANITPKTVTKPTSTTTKPKGFMTKTSGTAVPLNTIKEQIPANKAKSVATVRPTVQNQLTTNLSQKTNFLQRSSSPTSSSASSSSVAKLQNPSTSASSKTYRTIRFPVVPPKLSLPTAASPLSANNLTNNNNKKPAVSSSTTARPSTVLRKDFKRPATIVRPEKIISKDPANDPLNLDDISEAGSDNNSSFSDISGETYNSISDFEEDDTNDEFFSGDEEYYEDVDEVYDTSSCSQVIELSNDSSSVPSKLEDIRAPTPSPVITDDSNTSSSSYGFILSKKQTIKPYSHPAIIETVSRKGEKPKLLELLRKFNLLEDSVANINEANIVIDITTSRENLVENTDTPPQQVTSTKHTLSSANTIIDPVDSTANNKSLTLNTPNVEHSTINSSKETNKKKKKKSLRNMDATNDYSTDSDLSAVEELLEESYAEAMKRINNNVPFANQDVGAEIVIGREQELTIVEEIEQKLPKVDVVIDSNEKSKEMEADNIANKTENLEEQADITNREENEDQLNKDTKNLEGVTKDQAATNEQSKTDTKETNPDNNNETELKMTSIECRETEEILKVVKPNSTTDSISSRKKKRFRNLRTPDPYEKSSDETKSMDDLTDFTGFDEETTKPKENIEKFETKEQPQTAKTLEEAPAAIAKPSEKNLPLESFKSPSKTHQSLKEAKSKSSRESSLDSRDKSSSKQHSKTKSSGDSSKDRSSRESSKDKSSRESSKDRCRDSSKHRSKRSSRDKDHRSKHHHRDPRRSSDSKDSSKSHESSKSADSRGAKNSSKHSSDKKDKSLQENRDKSNETQNQHVKPSNVTEKSSTTTMKSLNESKSDKDRDNRKDSKERKSSADKHDRKSSETRQKTLKKDVSKSSNTSTQESKQNKDMNKSLSGSSTSASRESSKDRKSSNKKPDSSKSAHESKKSEKSKVTTDPNKSLKSKNSSAASSKSDKVQNSTEQLKDASKYSPANASKDKIKCTNESDKPLKDAADKKLLQNPAICSSELKLSKTVGGDSTGSSSDTPQKTTKTESQNKHDIAGTDQMSNENKEQNKIPNTLESSHKIKNQTPVRQHSKDAADFGSGAKHSDGSSKKLIISETTNKLSSENIHKPKNLVKADELKSNPSTSKELDSKQTSNSPKRSHNSKQEKSRNIEQSNKSTKTTKDRNLEDSKGEKSTNQKSKDKTSKNKKLVESKTENSVNQNYEEKSIENKTEVSEKSDNADKNEKEIKMSESNLSGTNKNETEKQGLCKTQHKIALEKNEPQEAPKKDDPTDKTNANEANNKKSNTSIPPPQTPLADKCEMKETASTKGKQNESLAKGSTKPATPASKAQKTKTPQKKQEAKQQKSATKTPKNPPIKTKDLSAQNATKPLTAECSATNKETSKDKKLDLKATSSSPKPSKQPQSIVPKIKTELNRTGQKMQNKTSHESKSGVAETDKTETEERHNDTGGLETKSKSATNLDIATNEDVKSKKVKVKEKEKPTESLVDATKQPPTNVKQSNVGKMEKADKKKESQPEIEDEDEPSSKTKRLMETVLKKSVVILVEPLKSIPRQCLATSNEDEVEIEPRRTRSRNENLKQNDSIAKENCTKVESLEKVATRKPKRTTQSQSPSDNNNENKSEQISGDGQQMKEATETSEAKVPQTIDEKSKNEEGSKEATDEPTSNKQRTLSEEKTDVKTCTQYSKNQENVSTIFKSEEKGAEAESTDTTNLKMDANKSDIENNKIEAEENIACESKSSNFDPIATRQKTELKTGAKEKSERLGPSNSTPLKTTQQLDSKAASESKETSPESNACTEQESSKRTQTRKKAALKSDLSNKSKTLDKQKSSADTKNGKHNLDPIKSQRKADLKTEGANLAPAAVGKTTCEESSSAGTQAQKLECKESKTRQKSDLKAELKKSDTENKETTDIKMEQKANKLEQMAGLKTGTEETDKTENFESTKTESENCQTDDRDSFNQTGQSSALKKDQSKVEAGENPESSRLNSDSIKTRQSTQTTKPDTEEADKKKLVCETKNKLDSKKVANASEICDEKQEHEESSFEPIVTRQKVDLKTDANKSVGDETKVKPIKMAECKENNIEPIGTALTVDLKAEAKTCDVGQNKNTDVCRQVIVTTEAEKLSETEFEEEKFEPMRTRSRIGQKSELDAGKSIISHNENSSRIESKDTRKSCRKTLNCHDDETSLNQNEMKNKEESIKQIECIIYGAESLEERSPEHPVKEPMKTRRRGHLKEEVQSSENEKTDNDLEPIKTRRRGDAKVENNKSKIGCLPQASEKEHEKKENQKGLKDDGAESKLREDSKGKHESLQAEKPAEETTPSIVSKTRVDGVDVKKEENKKESCDEIGSDCLAVITAVDGGDKKSEFGNDENKKSTSETPEAKIMNQEEVEEQPLEPRVTRSRAEIEIQSTSEGKSATEKSSEPKSTKKEATRTSKESIQTDEKLLEATKTRSELDDLKQKEQTPSAENKPCTTADKKQPENLHSQVTTDEAAHNEITEQSITLRIISEIDSICQEISENEMSGFESSSSGTTDNTIRRTLRKRGTDSPFPENENAKKQFKEPPQKANLTPKNTKTEKIVPNVSKLSSKRLLRSPAPETETQNPAKKPKLDPTKKSTRFRNLHDNGLGEEPPLAPTKTGALTKDQPQAIEEKKLNESAATTVCHTAPSEITKEVKDNTKSIDLLEKKVEVRTQESKTPHTSENILPDETLDNESTQQSTNKGESSKSKADVGKEAAPPVQLKAGKTKLKTTPNKSPASASGSTSVLSFSDWLKTKNKNTPSESEDSQDNSVRQSRTRAKITPKFKESLEKSTEVSQTSPADATMTLKANEKVSVPQTQITVRGKLNISSASDCKTPENMNATQQLDNSLTRLPQNQLQSDYKEETTAKNSNKKANVKRLQAGISKPNKPTLLTPSRHKKSEIAQLIESMSKEMKDGGITDLLNTEMHIKRQRLPNTKNFSLRTAMPSKESRTLTATPVVLQLANTQHANEMPKIMNVSENLGYKNKSPTRRNAAKSRKSTPLAYTDSSSRDSTNTPDTTVSTEQQTITAKDPKIRKSLNIKDLPRQTETATSKTLTTTDVIKTRKSMPLMPSETLSLANKNAKLSPRKALTNSKQQQISGNKAFKLPKATANTISRDKIPTSSAESIKKSHAGDKSVYDNCLKLKQTEENLLKKFKCRSLIVRLDRTNVQNFLNSTTQRGQQTLTGENQSSARRADNFKIIQNNFETNLRIQSVVNASTLLGASSSSSSSLTAVTNTQATPTNVISNTFNVQNSNRTAPISTPVQPYVLAGASGSETVPLLNESFELKNELMDENPAGSMVEAILPDTPTLLARAQTITQAAHQALSNTATPTDIRLLATDSMDNHFVPSFGVTPTALDNRGTCMYTFLHPAKYNRNHSNVLLDYCCPNLDGPMPAIDPTRIHAQVQVPVIELPASIVLTTKVVTRADLDNGDTSIPAIIRKKAEKIRKNLATHHKMAVSTVNTLPSTIIPSSIATASASARTVLPPTINALTKQLPSTTTITAKIRSALPQQAQMLVNQTPPPPSSVASTLPKTTVVSVMPKGGSMSQLTACQQPSLRSNLRRFDVLLKQLVQPYDGLSFVERHRIIETVVASGKCVSKDLEQTLVLMEEYIKQTMLLRNEVQQAAAPLPSAIMSTNNYIAPQPATQMPQLQPSPKILASKASAGSTSSSYSSQFEQSINKSIRKVPPRGKNIAGTTSNKHQVPIYDTDRNIIGYQMQMTTNSMSTMPAYTKSTMSSNTGAIMSTSPHSSITAYKITRRPLKRPAQDSPRVFYTTPPLKSSTPKALTNSNIYPNQHAKAANTISQKSQQGSIVTTVRTAGPSSSANSGTITTTTMATVKRVTRSTATGSKIIIVSKSNQSSEETILPDTQEQTQQPEIKHEKDIEDFIG